MRWIRWFFSLAAVGVFALLSGCMSVGPDYEKPEVALPDQWHENAVRDVESGESPLVAWWKIFGDDTLAELISRASTNNLNLKVAAARIEEAAALRGVSASQFYPDIVAGGSASAVQTRSASTMPGADRRSELYEAGLTMAWELDLWGRIRRSVESAEASLQASVENYRDIMVVLYADVAKSYINVRTLQERIHLAESNLVSQAQTLELTQNRFDAGLSPKLDVSQAELNRARTESSIPPLKQALVQEINRLCVLTGEPPYALQPLLQARRPIPSADGGVVAGLPAELLRQRPDLRRAERGLAAQVARIGAAKAELYPTLALPGTLTFQSSDSGLFEGGNSAFSLGPQLKWNLFNAGRIRSQVEAERAAAKAALHTYEQTVLLALEEVEDFMAGYAHEKERFQSLEAAEASANQSVQQVNELYKSGLTDFQNVLIMEEALFLQQDQLALSKGKISVGLVNIYKALGGGWNPDAAE